MTPRCPHRAPTPPRRHAHLLTPRCRMDAKKLERQRLSELKNGRAAMLGLVGCLVAGNLPGAIPVPNAWLPGASFTLPF